MNALSWLARRRKALLAGAIALTGGMATATADGHLTQTEGWIVAGATVVALAGVEQIRNGKPRPAGDE